MLKRKLLVLFLLLNAGIIHAQKNNTALWRISNPAKQQSSYLFGTIHLPQEKFMLLTDSVYQAVLNTNIFYGELNYANLYSEMSDNNDGFYDSKLKYIDSVQKTSSWKRMIESVNRNYHTNINADSADQFNKFGQSLMEDYMAAEPGVTALDVALSRYAITMGKPTRGLETFRFQLDMLYKIIDARLSDTTLLFNDEVVLAENMKRYYTNQQLDSITPIIESMNINYRKIAFDNRNFIMADSIAQITSDNTAFFAVGCGHLLGKNGLISLLRAKGLQLTPVFSNNKLSITRMASFFGSFNRTIKKELKKNDTDDEVIPDERIEEIREERLIPLPLPPPPPMPKKPVKKPAGKKSTAKKS